MRVAVTLFVLSAACLVAGTAMFSPRVAVLAAGAVLAIAGLSQIEVKK